jgi:large-conductance mechanosensitive channel
MLLLINYGNYLSSIFNYFVIRNTLFLYHKNRKNKTEQNNMPFYIIVKMKFFIFYLKILWFSALI